MVTLTWTSVACAIGYRVYRSTQLGAENDATKTTVIESPGTDTSFTDGFNAGTAGSVPSASSVTARELTGDIAVSTAYATTIQADLKNLAHIGGGTGCVP